ncbi:MAG: hypothetical protein ACTSSH_02135 [Candidatus Heimdallarchaeota archaeon]
MTNENDVICDTCGSSVSKGKFCPKCGALLGSSEEADLADTFKRLIEIKEYTDKLRASILLDKLSLKAERALLKFREDFSKIFTHFERKKEFLPVRKTYDETQEIEQNMTYCRVCGNIVPAIRYCKECGLILFASPLFELNSIIASMNVIIQDFTEFRDLINGTFSANDLELCENIAVQLTQFSSRLLSQKNVHIRIMAGKKPTDLPILDEAGIPIEFADGEVVDRAQQPRVWSKLEKSLLNYWFFYLAIILFSIGVTLTIYFVVLELENVTTQIIIIYSLGGGIVIIGQLVAILSRRYQKKRTIKESEIVYEPGDTTAIGDVRAEIKQKRQLPLPQFATIIAFIGFIVMYVGGIVGISGNINKDLFMYVSFGLAALSIVLGIINKSEMLTLTGFIPIIVFTAIDLLWTTYPPVLNGIASLIMFILPFILATLVAIFFGKWWGTIIVMSITPFILLIPKVACQVALEFIPLILIPVMILLVIRFNKGTIPVVHKRILAGLSLLFSSISLLVLTHPSITNVLPEASWAKLYPFEILIACIFLLGISFYYRFIQEEHLEIKLKINIYWIIGLVFTGLISVFLTIFNIGSGFDSVTTSLFFGLFFIFGIVQMLKPMQKYTSLAGKAISFVFAELEVILILAILNPTSSGEEALYFILAIAFAILAFTCSVIPKIFVDSNVMFIVWSIISSINIIIQGALENVNAWYAFVGLLLTLVISAIVNLPFIATRKKDWRIKSITMMGLSLIVLIVFLLTIGLSAFKFEALVMFLIFVVINIPAYFDWKTKEVQAVE